MSIIEFFSKLKTLLQINNSNNKTIKGNNNIIVGENAAIIQNPINIKLELPDHELKNIALSAEEQSVMQEMSQGAEIKYLKNESGIIDDGILCGISVPKEIPKEVMHSLFCKNLIDDYWDQNFFQGIYKISPTGRRIMQFLNCKK